MPCKFLRLQRTVCPLSVAIPVCFDAALLCFRLPLATFVSTSILLLLSLSFVRNYKKPSNNSCLHRQSG